MSDEWAARELAARRRASDWAPEYQAQLREVAEACGGELVGTEYEVKSIDSLARKAGQMREEGYPVDQALTGIKDLNRYTVVFPEPDYTDRVERFHELLADKQLTFEAGKNTWHDPFYRGYNVVYRDQRRAHTAVEPAPAETEAPRHPVEVQFHTRASYAAKQQNHPLYELIRSSELTPDEEAAAKALQAERSQDVIPPPGHERLPDLQEPCERPRQVSEAAKAAVRERVEQIRTTREAEAEPARLTPEQSRAGRRDDYWDAGRDSPDRGGAVRG